MAGDGKQHPSKQPEPIAVKSAANACNAPAVIREPCTEQPKLDPSPRANDQLQQKPAADDSESLLQLLLNDHDHANQAALNDTANEAAMTHQSQAVRSTTPHFSRPAQIQSQRTPQLPKEAMRRTLPAGVGRAHSPVAQYTLAVGLEKSMPLPMSARQQAFSRPLYRDSQQRTQDSLQQGSSGQRLHYQGQAAGFPMHQTLGFPCKALTHQTDLMSQQQWRGVCQKVPKSLVLQPGGHSQFLPREACSQAGDAQTAAQVPVTPISLIQHALLLALECPCLHLSRCTRAFL